MNLSSWSVKRPVGIFMAVAMVLVLGLVSFRNLAINLYPDMELPFAVVTTSYDGAAPEDIEETVTQPLEDSLSTLEGLDTLSSQSSSGSSLIQVQFEFGTDLDQAMLDIRESIDGASAQLPEGADDPSVLSFDPDSQAMMWIGISGDTGNMNMQQLAQERIQPQLEQGSGVASASIEGLEEREIEAQLRIEDLNRYQLTADDVVNALNAENDSGSVGEVQSGGQDLQLRVDGEFTSVEDIENTLIPLPDGGNVQLSDVADVVDTVADNSSETYVNGSSSVMFSIMKQSDANTVEVSQSLTDIVNNLNNNELGDGAQLEIVYDSADYIESSINSVFNNLLFGALFAVLVLLAFLRSVRATMVIAISIPISIVATFTLMYFTGESLNILTMGGLALGVGMMVDSAIVILEGIYKHIEYGKSRKEAAIAGAKELGSAVVASTSTTLVVFLPLVFVQGISSELFTPLALTVSFALIASLIAALTIVPMFASKFIKEESKKPDENSRFNRLGRAVNDRYQRMLRWSLRFRKTVMLMTFVLVIGSLALVPAIGAVFIPESDQGEIAVNVETPEASTKEETRRAVQQVWNMLEPYQDSIDSTYSSLGGGGGAAAAGGGGGSNTATVNISLVDSSERQIETSGMISDLSEQADRIAGAEVSVSNVASGAAGSGTPITVSISGQEQDVLRDLAEQAVFEVESIPGTMNVENSSGEGSPQLELNIDRQQASQYGLTYQNIMGQVMTSFNGQVATEYNEEGEEISVEVILPGSAREQISDVRNLTLTGAQGAGVPLAAVAELNETTGPTQITREDSQRQIDITSDVAPGYVLGSVSTQVQEAMNSMNMPDGYTVDYGGEQQDMQEAFGDLGLALVASIFLVYAVMAIQFESFIQPLVIMFSIPATLIGVLLGLFITQTPLSVTAFIGLIMLAGIVVNNAIVLVDYINQRRSDGLERDEAIMDAGPSRLRPILMTVMTTILAMLPVALGIGEGAESQAPMAIVIVFGLAFSTLFTLILIPVVYASSDNIVLWFKRKAENRREKKRLKKQPKEEM
ncbi:efflux RND transporter permease subunit [Salibacterium halotolerans]|uniref:Hydrophobic/amphiphilic exporter-1, HAE1 family n=1 Tax=Salibacterium halotolerans TaxID=1884432 RepID=A0A1I5KZA9_9BACI|nr:efflux RND transporter permease subunit [Salibacterium halotolerans]SFO90248.1 hydrophobic/amphiphilic exporter-1, HAE1 family [Salibacterium halotolerans]